MKKIAVCVIATSVYKNLLNPLIESMKKHLLSNEEVSLFIFCDYPSSRGWLETHGYEIFWTQISHQPFPLPTLFRHRTLLQREQHLREFEYIFHFDADVLFVGDIGSEILGEGLTATQHPSASYGNKDIYLGKDPKDIPLPVNSVDEPIWKLNQEWVSHTFEKNKKSKAFIPSGERKKYFAGAFQGGKSDLYIHAMQEMSYNIDTDLGQNIIARYHDESHWNRYLVDNPPKTILPFWYCFPEWEDWQSGVVAWKREVCVPEGKQVKMLCLDKDMHGGYESYRGNAKK